MKKTIISLLAVSFFFWLSGFKLKAEEYILKNILDLKNITIGENPEESYRDYYIATAKPIELVEGNTYTFVISEDYYGKENFSETYFDYELFYYFKNPLTNETYGRTNTYKFKDSYAYMTFTATYSLFVIKEFPINIIPDTPNQDIMLFEGDIQLFDGSFTNYKTQYITQNWVYLKDYDKVISTLDIISNIKVLGAINEDYKIVFDEYTPNQDKLGEYSIVLMATNESNNKSLLKIIVKNTDITPPVFTGSTFYKVELKKDMPLVEVVTNSVDVRDNSSLINKQDIIIKSDNYTPNKDNLGSYLVVLEAKDEAGNTTLLEVTIEVYDDTAPVITGPRQIYRYSTDPILTNDDIKSFFTITDNVDEQIESSLIITGSHEQIPGFYEYTLTVSDLSGNTTTVPLTVHVLSGSQPHFNYDGGLIITYGEYKNMTHEDIKEWILNNHKEATNINILIDESKYLKDKDEAMYLYYSYELNNQTYYERILIESSNEKAHLEMIIAGVLLVINVSLLVVFIKRPKIHF